MKDKSLYRGGLTRFWWVPLITGLVCIGFGVWCLCAPVSAFPVMAYIFTALIVAAGLLNLIYAFANRRFDSNWGWSLAMGIFEIIAGVWMLTLPVDVLEQAFIFVMGVWLLVVCINSICEASMMAAYSPIWIPFMIIILICAICFICVFLSVPLFMGLTVWLWLGISLILFGSYRVMLAIKLNKLNQTFRSGLL